MSDSDCSNPQLQSPLNRSSKDKFIMILELPYVLRKRAQTDPTIDVNPLQISVFGTIVPDLAVPEVDARYAGQHIHLSSYSRPNYPPLTISFVVDNEYKNYYMLWKWLDTMNLAIESLYGGTQNPTGMDKIMKGDQFEYQTTFSILALNEYNEVALKFEYTKAFISTLGGIQYSYRDGALLEATAKFHFRKLNITKPVTSSKFTSA